MKKLCTSSAIAHEKCLQTQSRLGGPKLLKSIAITGSLVSLFLSVFVSPIHAEDVSLVVSPPRNEIEGKPGETIQKTIKITNNSETSELILKVLVKDFIVQDDLGTPIPVSPTIAGKYLASPWFTLEKDEIVIPAKTTDQVVVIVTIPDNALPGGHYAGVFFQPVPARNMKNTVSYTAAQVGSLYSVNIPGDIKFDAVITNFSTKMNVSEFGPIDFSATIENQSDTHIKPIANIVIHDMIGRKLADLPLEETNIFPYTSRLFSSSWENIWGLGRYTATLTASYGPGLVATRVLYFWIMPYRLLLTILVIALVIVAAIILIRRHLKHLGDHRDEEIDELKRKIVEMENKHS